MAILRLESGPENSRLGSGENGAARYHPQRPIGARRHWKFALSLAKFALTRGRPDARGGSAKDNARLVDNREPAAESSSAPRSKVPRDSNPRPGAQSLRRDCERSGLPPVPAWYRPYAQSTHFCPCKTKRLLALWFQCHRVRMTDWQTNLSGTVRLQRCLDAAVPTDLTPLR